jgi:hypothetical protein
MSRPVALLSVALPALLAAAPPPACIIYGQGATVTHIQEVPAQAQMFLAPEMQPGAKIGFAYKYWHLWWIPFWTWDGAYAVYLGDRYWPLTPEGVRLVFNKSEDELSKPFFYHCPAGLVILATILLACLLRIVLVRRRAPPRPSPELLGPPGHLIPARPLYPADFCYRHLYQPPVVLHDRLPSLEEFGRFCRDVEEAVREFATMVHYHGQSLSLFIGLRPGGRSRFWLEFRPDGVPAEAKQALLRRLEAVRPPEVRGEVAAASYSLLWGGPGYQTDVFAFIPYEWRAALGGGQGLIPEDVLHVAWPEAGPARATEDHITDRSGIRRDDRAPNEP